MFELTYWIVSEPFSSPFMKYNLNSSKATCDTNTSVGKIINTSVANILPEKYHNFRYPCCFWPIVEDVFSLRDMSKTMYV